VIFPTAIFELLSVDLDTLDDFAIAGLVDVYDEGDVTSDQGV
jgi:hypothetical protein